MISSALLTFYRIAEFSDIFPQWCVLEVFRSTLFDNRVCVEKYLAHAKAIFVVCTVIVVKGDQEFYKTLVS